MGGDAEPDPHLTRPHFTLADADLFVIPTGRRGWRSTSRAGLAAFNEVFLSHDPAALNEVALLDA